MKHLWAAVAVLAIMLLVFSWNGARLTNLIEPQQDTLDLAVQAARTGEWEQTEKLTQQVADHWKDSISYLHLVQSHRDVDEVTILLEESLEYAQTQNISTYCAINARIQGLMDGIRMMEKFSFENLM
ncbi:MAG: DUF4363 family protein [Ruminiclostridium sp.]|nr:DUF4363 family protein [Ruminiclostridium sp.]